MARRGKASSTGCFLISLLSIPVLTMGIWLRKRAEFDCVRYLDTPLIVLGVLLIWCSLGASLRLCQNQGFFSSIAMFNVVILLAVLFGYVVFAFTVSYKDSVGVTTGSGYEEYTLKSGNNWLQRWVKDQGKWSKIKGRLQYHNLCDGLITNKDSSGRYIYTHPSPAQSGCCKPPYECGFVYHNATAWDIPRSGPPSSNIDCTTWSNDQKVLCYNCLSCKAGVVKITQRDWKKVAIINIVFISMILVVQAMACCFSFLNSVVENASSRKPSDEKPPVDGKAPIESA